MLRRTDEHLYKSLRRSPETPPRIAKELRHALTHSTGTYSLRISELRAFLVGSAPLLILPLGECRAEGGSNQLCSSLGACGPAIPAILCHFLWYRRLQLFSNGRLGPIAIDRQNEVHPPSRPAERVAQLEAAPHDGRPAMQTPPHKPLSTQITTRKDVADDYASRLPDSQLAMG
jgi:hypothetical protein